MTLDDRLKRAVDTLGDRLREEITRELRMVTEELSAEAHAEREAAVQSAVASVHSAIIANQPPPQEPESTRLLEAIRTIDEARSLTAILDSLIAHAAREASRAGVLIVRGDRVHAWRDATVDVPVVETGIVAEAIRTTHSTSTTTTGVMPPPFGNASAGSELSAFPLSLSGDVVALLYAEDGNAAMLEILTRHAARVLESLTAFKTARTVAGISSNSESGRADAPVADDEEAAARRYAHQLISEIKRYHEEAVEAGRRERDLSARLGGEIARARSLYAERVPAHVPHAADYFRDELVQTLAGGDPSLLIDVSAA